MDIGNANIRQRELNLKVKKYRISRKPGERIFDSLNSVFLLMMCFATIYPFWYILVLSFNNGNDAAAGPIWFWPRKFTIDNYIYVLNYDSLKSAFVVTIARCIIGSLLSVLVCTLAAYALSKRYLPGRKLILYYFMMPMFIGGSMISYYVVIVKIHLLNNFLVYVLPGAFGFFSMVIIRTFIEGLPPELEEAAMLDGANYWTIFTHVVLPLSKPVLAAFIFFGIVGGWLDLYTNLLFVTSRKLYTLQYILYMVINSSESQNMINYANSTEYIKHRLMENQNQSLPTPQVVQMTVMVVVTFPLLFVYPFFQKYFVKGMMVGAIKA